MKYKVRKDKVKLFAIIYSLIIAIMGLQLFNIVFPNLVYAAPELWNITAKPSEFGEEVNGNQVKYTVSSPEGLSYALYKTTSDSYSNVTIKIAQYIDMSAKSWKPVDISRNTLTKLTIDGQGNMIVGLNIYSSSNYVGLLGSVSKTIEVSGLKINVSSISLQNSSASYYGGIAGYVSSKLTASGCAVYGNTSSDKITSYFGGLFGYISSTSSSLTRCLSYATLTANKASYLGGIVGYSQASISTCGIFSGALKSSGSANIGGVVGYSSCSSISTSFNSAILSSGSGVVGGLVGISSGATTFTNCYNTGNITSGGKVIGGIIGKSNSGSSYFTNCYSTGTLNSAENSSMSTSVSEDKYRTYTATSTSTSDPGSWYININNCSIDSEYQTPIIYNDGGGSSDPEVPATLTLAIKDLKTKSINCNNLTSTSATYNNSYCYNNQGNGSNDIASFDLYFAYNSTTHKLGTVTIKSNGSLSKSSYTFSSYGIKSGVGTVTEKSGTRSGNVDSPGSGYRKTGTEYSLKGIDLSYSSGTLYIKPLMAVKVTWFKQKNTQGPGNQLGKGTHKYGYYDGNDTSKTYSISISKSNTTNIKASTSETLSSIPCGENDAYARNSDGSLYLKEFYW